MAKTKARVAKVSTVKYVEGDLFKNIAGMKDILIPHVCNDIGGWGSGFVVPLGRTFPLAQHYYLAWYRFWQGTKPSDGTVDPHGWVPGGHEGHFGLGQIQAVHVDIPNNIHVVNMVAQHQVGGPPRPIRYNSLANCMDRITEIWLPNKKTIHAPLFGSQLAGGRWDFIAELIQDCWLNKGFDVTIHYLPGQLPEGF